MFENIVEAAEIGKKLEFLEIVIRFCVYSFIRLADYLIVNTMHVLAVNSVSTLLNYLTEQLQNTPPLSEIQEYNKVIYSSSSLASHCIYFSSLI